MRQGRPRGGGQYRQDQRSPSTCYYGISIPIHVPISPEWIQACL
ncbi:hypothetical protein HRUBRA_02721 [Pseudohaliea rubra DSM 19751]|uniref:Uncharacterized protein n=1 Tax=Pseudohaliea rubra DSM 19751 TaxID=1265313 RepID=A0A095VNQ9_9GAMM|nr:hypothetical protein HRUBRA_02721 [Pseudohaliea rubra DSM 19751]